MKVNLMPITIQKIEITIDKISSDQFIELKTSIIHELSCLARPRFSWEKGYRVTISHKGEIKAHMFSGKRHSPQFIGNIKLLDSSKVEIRGRVILSYLPIVLFLLVLLMPLCSYLLGISGLVDTKDINGLEYFLLLILLVAVINAMGFLRFSEKIDKAIDRAVRPYLLTTPVEKDDAKS
ncbi:MAG: hypothetical protein JJ978_10525 [Roseivirga sp.]|jgi:hypothetical protein|uniref:hypothetical protein n=1 Tax=Roseivirga sp. TaxID=1964215 RepID=UPI001B2B3E02|nr:hypothetical protein [Roseivirga sp.]MBO6495990.1 hypothetical protein [Roseivirga sp.]